MDKKQDGFKGERMIVLPTEAFRDYVRHPQVRRLYLTDVGYFPRAQSHYRERREGIEEYILLYCMEGSGAVRVEGKEYALGPNEAFCIPRLRGHSYRACEEDPWSLLWVHFSGEDTARFPLEEQTPRRLGAGDAANRIYFLFDMLLGALEGSYTLGNFIYISQVLGLVLAEIYCREKEDGPPSQNRRLTWIIKYMYRHLGDELTLEGMSEEFGLSKSYLNALFQKYTQHAPMDFYNRLRVREACKLLRSTDLYIYEIARRVGFADQYYFSRIFKKLEGVPPREYRERQGDSKMR